MFIWSRDEKLIVLQHRIEMERVKTLFGLYGSYAKGEEKIKKLQNKMKKLEWKVNEHKSI